MFVVNTVFVFSQDFITRDRRVCVCMISPCDLSLSLALSLPPCVCPQAILQVIPPQLQHTHLIYTRQALRATLQVKPCISSLISCLHFPAVTLVHMSHYFIFLYVGAIVYIGYTTGTPYKVPPAQTNGAPPPYSASPNPYSTAMYPIRSAYPQQNLYAQVASDTHPPPRKVLINLSVHQQIFTMHKKIY